MQEQALDNLDKIIYDENNSAEYDLKKSDITFFNNRIIHGRTSFEDYEENEKKRLMIRSWIKNN